MAFGLQSPPCFLKCLKLLTSIITKGLNYDWPAEMQAWEPGRIIYNGPVLAIETWGGPHGQAGSFIKN
jgi:hypothetical protein